MAVWVGPHLSEGDVCIHGRFLGQPEGAFTEDVALDLVGTAGDGLAGYRDDDLVDQAVERCVRPAEHAACTGDPGKFDATDKDGLAAEDWLIPPKSNWARAIERPPFLAYPLIGAIAYTFGGIATDTRARVLGVRGPIPGLFAAGEITGHFHGTAPNAVAVLRAVVYGRIAGGEAARA